MHVTDDLFEASFLRNIFSTPPGLLVTLPRLLLLYIAYLRKLRVS